MRDWGDVTRSHRGYAAMRREGGCEPRCRVGSRARPSVGWISVAGACRRGDGDVAAPAGRAATKAALRAARVARGAAATRVERCCARGCVVTRAVGTRAAWESNITRCAASVRGPLVWSGGGRAKAIESRQPCARDAAAPPIRPTASAPPEVVSIEQSVIRRRRHPSEAGTTRLGVANAVGTKGACHQTPADAVDLWLRGSCRPADDGGGVSGRAM